MEFLVLYEGSDGSGREKSRFDAIMTILQSKLVFVLVYAIFKLRVSRMQFKGAWPMEITRPINANGISAWISWRTKHDNLMRVKHALSQFFFQIKR